jgi:predicted phage baseplate assembly protein
VALPAPNLDDRRFQNLVDDAKRLVQKRCPEWTDHNVSDPGVTLIEAFAYMVDQLLYRVNRVPDKNYVRFLDLIGVKLFPPTPARTDVTFWLSTPQPVSIDVRAGSVVATPRGDQANPAVTFTTAADLELVSCERDFLCSVLADGSWRNHTDTIALDEVAAFAEQPAPGDSLLIGLTAAVPSCAVSLRLACGTEGVGVDPAHPPIVWEAFDGTDWLPCAVDRDTTGGFNQNGEVVLHVPVGHQMALVRQLRAGWLRARLLEPVEGQAFYSHSPSIGRIDAATIGGTVPVIQGEVIEAEDIGFSEGIPGQRFVVRRTPVVRAGEPVTLEVAEGEGWETWTEVEHFAHSGPDDLHFSVDAVVGEIVLGPSVRNPDGTVAQHGYVPPPGAALRVGRYWTGGGRRGNVAAAAIRVCRTTIPFVARVENRYAARGGIDGETVEEAKVRGPITLRTIERAVTAEDYEHLARQAAPEAVRVRAVPADRPEDAGGLRVLLVPHATPDDQGRLTLTQLAPPEHMLRTVSDYLGRRRCVGARVMVEPPYYQGVTVVAQLLVHPWADVNAAQTAALDALYGYLNPLTGGPEGAGWPFGQAVHTGEIYAILQGVPGARVVEDVRLFAAHPISGRRGDAVNRVDVPPNALVFSYEHQVRVEV